VESCHFGVSLDVIEFKIMEEGVGITGLTSSVNDLVVVGIFISRERDSLRWRWADGGVGE